MSWQDTRASEMARRLDASLEQAQPGSWRRRGCRLHPGYGAVTLAWMAGGGRLEGATVACTLPDWMAAVLAGNTAVTTDPTQAASWGILDLARGAWDKEAAASAGVPTRLLPPIRAPGAVLGSADLGALGRDVVVVNGLGDNQAGVYAAIQGAAAAAPGYVVNVGTASQVSRVVDTSAVRSSPEGIEIRPYLDGRFLAVSASPNGGAVYAVVAHFLRAAGVSGVGDFRELYALMDSWAEGVAPGCDGLRCDPRFFRERDGSGDIGAFHGVGPRNFTPGHVCRSVLEGMARRLAEMAGLVGCRGLRGVAAGNGLRAGDLFRRILAEALGGELALSPYAEEAAVGAALVAARAI